MLETTTIMGLPFHRIDQRSLVRMFLDGACAGTGGWIVTPNLDILRQFTTSAESRSLILAAGHRVADGVPPGWPAELCRSGSPGASWSSVCPRPRRVPGCRSFSSVETPVSLKPPPGGSRPHVIDLPR